MTELTFYFHGNNEVGFKTFVNDWEIGSLKKLPPHGWEMIIYENATFRHLGYSVRVTAKQAGVYPHFEEACDFLKHYFESIVSGIQGHKSGISDDLCRAALKATKEPRERIQGFLYGNRYVIRDMTKPHGREQEIWEGPDSIGEEAWIERVDIECMRITLAAARDYQQIHCDPIEQKEPLSEKDDKFRNLVAMLGRFYCSKKTSELYVETAKSILELINGKST